MKIWYGVCTFNFHNHVNICTTACRRDWTQFNHLKLDHINRGIGNKYFTSQVIFQLVDHFSIFHKGNSIEINLVVHSKLNIFPVFVCWNDKSNEEILIYTHSDKTKVDKWKGKNIISTLQKTETEKQISIYKKKHWEPKVTCYWRKSCTFSTHVQVTSWFQLTTINYLALHQILGFWFHS